MSALHEAAIEVSQFFAEKKWPHCIIGGLAVQRWGRPRTTVDADFTLMVGWGNEERYISLILGHFRARVSEAAEFALQNRIALVCASNGVPVDIALGALPFEWDMVERAIKVDFGAGRLLPICTAEDLFILKVFAGRPADWVDIGYVVQRQSKMDTDYVVRQLKTLRELKPDIDLPRALHLLERLP